MRTRNDNHIIPVSPWVQARFFEKVEVREGCWHWTAARSPEGYGLFAMRSPRRNVRAHRMSWLIHVGIIPPGMLVLHKCDNPVCTNPLHLFLGTDIDNIQDCRLKGRMNRAKGSANGFSKLNELQVRAILRDGRAQSIIANHYSIAQSLVSRIKNEKIWKHVSK